MDVISESFFLFSKSVVWSAGGALACVDILSGT